MISLIKRLTIVALATLFFTACSKDSNLLVSNDLTVARQTVPATSTVPRIITLDQSNSKGKSLAIWSDCEAFGTVGTPTSFKPTAGNFDELYNGANFKDGLGAISESKPGDQDFNGGRWHVNTLKEGVDPNKYSTTCSVEEIDPNDFESTSTYFECPLLPARGNGN